MCRSKAEGGHRCQGPGTRHASHGTLNLGDSHNGRAAGIGGHLAAGIGAVSQQLDRAAAGGNAQYALEQAAARIRQAYTATAAGAGELEGTDLILRESMLGLASRIDTGLNGELTSRTELLEASAQDARDLARLAQPPGGRRAASPPAALSADDQAYLGRAAALDRRIAAGENITDIMKAEQLARGEEQIRRIRQQGW